MKNTILGIVTAGILFGGVYLGGMWVTTGALLPTTANADETPQNIVVASVKDGSFMAAQAKPAPKAAEKPMQIAQAAPVKPVVAPVAAPAAAEVEAFVADAAKGKKISAKCKACHTFNEGGKHRTGPNMWGIYEAPIAHHENFKYSKAMKAHGEGKTWTADELSAYLKNPRKHIPGNKMAFAGLKKEADRANLIAWLKTLK